MTEPPFLVVLSNGTRIRCNGLSIDAHGICHPQGKYMHVPPQGYLYAGFARDYEEDDA